jgi:predicted metal-dependent phosphoesterase TrpH
MAFWLGLVACAGLGAAAADPVPGERPAWYKGNIHAHSFWSDGDDFPEMAADWYRRHGYQFLTLSEHKLLAQGPRWRDVYDKERPIPLEVIEACRKRFGAAWVETRGEGEKLQVRLKTLDEVRAKLEEPGKFLLIQGEEITGTSAGAEVHVTALHLAEPIPHHEAPSIVETLRQDLRAVAEQARRLGRPIVAQVNHPSWPKYDVAAEDLAAVAEARLMEVCNASPGSNRLGDDKHPSVDRLWDIANTLRISRGKLPPIYGVASDDAHNYHRFSPDQSPPGRGWIMVRAEQLSAEAIVNGIARGDFYASTGVLLNELTYDARGSTLTVEVRTQPGAAYTIEFVGTPADYNPATELIAAADKDGKPLRPVRRYSADVGKVFLAVRGPRARYQLTGKELFVRAAVRSDQRMPHPPQGEGQFQEAWTQPVGWEKRVSIPRGDHRPG